MRTRAAVILVSSAVAVLTGCSAPAPALEEPITVPGPTERTTLFGTTVYRGDATFEQALARQDDRFGRLQVARIFYPGDPPPWPGSPAELADRPVVVSFKLPPSEVLTGLHDEALTAWFASVPADSEVWWVYFHEPEDNIEDGHFTAEQFRDAFRHISALSRQTSNPNLHPTLVLQCRTTKPAVGRNFDDYDPGADSYDVMGFDCYNREVRQGNYPDANAFLAPLLAVAESVDRPLGIAELGSQIVPGDDGTGRARWLEQVAVQLIDEQAPFVTYFDSPITGTDYRLDDAPSRAAWSQIITGTP
jgi:hypothetical protein